MTACRAAGIFRNPPSSYESESDKPVLPEIEHLRGKIGEEEFKSLNEILNSNADVFSKHKPDIGCCNFVFVRRRRRSPQGGRKAHDTS